MRLRQREETSPCFIHCKAASQFKLRRLIHFKTRQKHPHRQNLITQSSPKIIFTVITDMMALKKIACASFFCLAVTTIAANPPLLNDPVDVSGDFRALENFYYLADKVSEFDPAAHAGKIVYQRAQYHVRHAFNNDLALINAAGPNEFPKNQYAANPELPFSIEFVSPRTIRIRMTSGPQVHPPQPELMLAGDVPK